MKYIGLLDCNNFFVSCERLFRPDLTKRPVLVLSGNDGCVVARSNEVKELGITMGVPYFQIKDLCQKENITIFSTNSTLYRDISARVMKELGVLVPKMEQYSVDEAFFELTEQDVGVIEKFGVELKATIEQKVGIPVSIGVGQTKTIAKCASHRAKKGSGVCVWPEDIWRKQVADIPLATIWGIGASFSQKLQAEGLQTVADLLRSDQQLVATVFGVEGVRKQAELSGQSIYKVGAEHNPQQSIMSTRSFAVATNEYATVADALAHHIAVVAKEAREMKQLARTLTVIAKPSRHKTFISYRGVGEVILPEATNDTRELLKQMLAIFSTLYNKEIPYKKAGVVIGGLISVDAKQQTLFSNTNANEKGEAVMQILDAINNKFGTETVTIGRQQRSALWQTKGTHLSPSYTTKWLDLAIVKA